MSEPEPTAELVTRTAKLLPYPKRSKSVPSLATAYHYETETNPEASELGNLYVVAEVMASNKQAQEVIDLVIETIGHHYFNLGEHFNSKPGAILRRFEDAIKATNEELSNYTNRGNASWVGRMSAIIAVIADSEVHITQTGSAEAYLYRANASSQITSGLQPKGPNRPIATFANIASGQLQMGDRLLIATPALFHQLPKTELKSLAKDNTPNGAIQKLSALIQNVDDADRIATIIVEVTSAEIMALQTRPSEPDEVKIGQPSRPFDVAKEVTRPVVGVVMSKTKELGQQGAAYGTTKVVPKLRQTALQVTKYLRAQLSHKRGRQRVMLGLALIVVLIVWRGYSQIQAQTVQNLAKRYDAIFTSSEKAESALAKGDKKTAHDILLGAQKDLSKLGSDPHHNALERTLSQRPHPENDPASISKLHAIIIAALDQIDGLSRVEPTLVADLSPLKDAKPNLFELVGSKVVFIGSQNNASISTYDLTTNKLGSAIASPADLGKVVASTVSSNGDSVYLLTAEPSVWSYRPDDNSFKRQTTSFGDWPKGRAIASYGGNLYILADDGSQVYKHVPTSGGFSAKQGYFASSIAPNLAGSSSIAVDGSIYIGGGTAPLKRYVSNARLDQTAAGLPETSAHPSSIHSIAGGSLILMIDGKSSRIALVDSTDNAISFKRQYSGKGLERVYQVQTDPKATTIFALTDGKLLKFGL